MTASSAKGKTTKKIIAGDRFGKAEKRQYKRIARELFYHKAFPNIEAMIDACETEADVAKLMMECRKAC